MTDTLLGLVPTWGALLVGIANFLSCIALPIPASLIMLAAGAFVAAGDLTVTSVWIAAAIGAVTGDQAGYALGRWGGEPLIARLTQRRTTRKLATRAIDSLTAQAALVVFFSRWLVSALGPYVNLAAGATRLNWVPFTVFGVVGELIWVSLYIGIGYAFSSQIDEVGSIVGNVSGALAAGVVAIVFGRMLIRVRREEGEP